jgi:ABC-type transport system involved in multi-copper enzyme maturation permease subunit
MKSIYSLLLLSLHLFFKKTGNLLNLLVLPLMGGFLGFIFKSIPENEAASSLWFLSLILGLGLIFFASSLVGEAMVIEERRNGTLEYILASGFSARELWLGKAVAMTGIVITVTLLGWAIMVMVYVWGHGMLPLIPAAIGVKLGLLIIGILILIFNLSLIVIGLGLVVRRTSVATGLANLLFIFTVFAGPWLLSHLNYVWLTPEKILGLAILLFAAGNAYLARFITEERVILVIGD